MFQETIETLETMKPQTFRVTKPLLDVTSRIQTQCLNLQHTYEKERHQNDKT